MMVTASLGRSRLHRLLSDWSSPSESRVVTDVAKLWASWLQPLQAVHLQQGLDAVAALPTGRAVAPRPAEVRALQHELARVRAAWGNAVDATELAPDDPATIAAVEARWPGHSALSGFERYRRVHLEWQRQMAAMVEPLRERARRAVARAGGRGQQLAAMDKLVDNLLAPSESRALAQLPVWLERRYRHRLGAEADPRPGSALFFADWQALVDAEVELRTLPVQGLIDACSQENS